MSRTFRRTEMNANNFVYGEHQRWVFSPDGEPRWKGVYKDGCTYEQYRAKAKAMLYSDKSYHNHYWEAPLPRWVRNLFQERPFRREVKRKLRKAVRFEEFDGLSVKRPPKDAWIYY